MNRHNKKLKWPVPIRERTFSQEKGSTTVWMLTIIVSIAVVVMILFLLATTLPQNANQPTPPSNTVSDVPETAEPINLSELEALGLQRLQEINEGQDLVSIRVVEDKDIYLITAPSRSRGEANAEEQALYYREDGACEDECIRDWTPYLVTTSFEGSRLTTVPFDDTNEQHLILLDNKMLFTYDLDIQPGDTNGLRAGNGWQLARP
jgi:hypothetical protein